MNRRTSPQTAAVLNALSARGQAWSHGYDLCRELGIKAGTMYPILMRLADRGQVETEWERDVPAGRPARHLYRLTEHGATAVRALAAGTITSRASAPAHPPVPGTRPRPALT
jgi:PadR family transcriptional regulator PadR